jgi:uncharacterized ion transporter superfamily protein YfcC
MSQQRKLRRKSALSQREEKRLADRKAKDRESWSTRFSRVAIMVVFAATIISLVYSIVLLSGY